MRFPFALSQVTRGSFEREESILPKITFKLSLFSKRNHNINHLSRPTARSGRPRITTNSPRLWLRSPTFLCSSVPYARVLEGNPHSVGPRGGRSRHPACAERSPSCCAGDELARGHQDATKPERGTPPPTALARCCRRIWIRGRLTAHLDVMGRARGEDR